MQIIRDWTGAASVTYTAEEVREFKNRWPGSGLPYERITFHMEKNGDLWSVSGAGEYDGPDLLALSEDARKAAFP